MQTDKEEFILVMGPTGAGKTSLINSVSRSALKVGHGLRSCTSEVNFSDPFMVMGRKIVLFDTPGFDDTNRSDTEILTEIALFLTKFYEQKSKLIGVIYLHDITQHRMGGSAVRNVKMFHNVVGPNAAKNVVVVTTKWDLLPNTQAGDERQKELEDDPDFFKPILSAGATIQPFVKGENPMVLIENIIKRHKRTNLRLVDEMMEGKKLNETDAGRVLNKDIDDALKAAKEAHEKQIKDMQDQIRADNKAQFDMLIGMLKEANEEKIRLLKEKQDLMDQRLDQLQNTSIAKRVNDMFGSMWDSIKGGARTVRGWFN